MQSHAETAVKEHLRELQKTFFQHWKGNKNAPFAYIPEAKIKQILRQSMQRSDRYKRMKADGASEAEIEKAFKTKIKMNLKLFKIKIRSKIAKKPITK
jgi:penicillin-binding protein 1A